jgi:hypothetical protein
VLVTPLWADEITDQIDAARKSYEEGELRSAVQGLQFAIAGIQEKVNLSLLELLPEPLEGWKADDPQATSSGMAAMITGTNLTRSYYAEQGGGSLEISITADSPFLNMMTMMLSNPMMLQTDPNTRIYTHLGRRGMIKQDTAGRWEISLMGNNNVLVQVSGTGIDKDTAEAYLKAVDIEAVEKAFAR